MGEWVLARKTSRRPTETRVIAPSPAEAILKRLLAKRPGEGGDGEGGGFVSVTENLLVVDRSVKVSDDEVTYLQGLMSDG